MDSAAAAKTNHASMDQPDSVELPYTGLILAGLLEKQIHRPVLNALLAGAQRLLTVARNQSPLSAQMPTEVADLVLAFGSKNRRQGIVIEHKCCRRGDRGERL